MQSVAELFNSKTLAEKSALINNYGKTIHWTDYNEYRITLYEIDCHIIEVWFDIYNAAIRDIRIPTYDQLDIHLHTIKI